VGSSCLKRNVQHVLARRDEGGYVRSEEEREGGNIYLKWNGSLCASRWSGYFEKVS